MTKLTASQATQHVPALRYIFTSSKLQGFFEYVIAPFRKPPENRSRKLELICYKNNRMPKCLLRGDALRKIGLGYKFSYRTDILSKVYDKTNKKSGIYCRQFIDQVLNQKYLHTNVRMDVTLPPPVRIYSHFDEPPPLPLPPKYENNK